MPDPTPHSPSVILPRDAEASSWPMETDQNENMDRGKIIEAVRMILEAIGEDPDREGLRDTPRRVADMYREIFSGLHQDPREVLAVRFHVEHDEMVLVKDIPFYSACEHHLLPFFGVAHVAYLPGNQTVTGLSKLARLVDMVAKRPQIQERMTNTIADLLTEELRPTGTMVVIEAEHLCMNMRGIKKPGSKTMTMATRGSLSENSRAQEVLRMIRS